MAMRISASVTALLATLAQASTDGKCRALVLSGGSNNGAWETGVMWGLLHYGNPEDFAWDVVSGISAGAINTGGIATWPTGTEYEMTEWLSEKWTTLTTDDIWTLRSKNPFDLLFKEHSFLDDSPALATLKDIIADKGSIARRFAVGAVDVNTGDFIQMDQTNTTFDTLAQSALSSGSIPVVFPPQLLNGYVFMDGGTVWNVNLDSAVKQCMEIVGDDYSKIIVDVAICSYVGPPPEEPISKNALFNWRSSNSLHGYYASTDSLAAESRAFPGLNFRYYFQESNSCPGAGGLDFDNSTTWCLQEAGRADAQNMLNIG